MPPVFVNEFEAPALLEHGAPLASLAQAEEAADELLRRWPSLRAVIVTCSVAHVYRQRADTSWLASAPLRASRVAAAAVAPQQQGVGEAVLVVPRSKEQIIDVIGAVSACGAARDHCRHRCHRYRHRCHRCRHRCRRHRRRNCRR